MYIVSTVNNPDIWKSFKILVLIEGKMPQTCATMNYIRCVTHLITHQQSCVEPNSYSLLISLYRYIRQGKCQEENREWSCQTVAIKGSFGLSCETSFPALQWASLLKLHALLSLIRILYTFLRSIWDANSVQVSSHGEYFVSFPNSSQILIYTTWLISKEAVMQCS